MNKKKNMNGASHSNVETVIATGNNLIDALTDALLKINPRQNTHGYYIVKIEITKEVDSNGRQNQSINQ